MITPQQLSEIKGRNDERRKLKKESSPSPWEYDSFGFIHQSERIRPEKRIGILLRPMKWFDMISERYGNLIDQGFSATRFIQAYYDAEYIIHERNGTAEDDIDLLINEVIRLRKGDK